VIQRVAILLLLASALLPAQTDGPVVGVGPFLHIVSDLDQSLDFYHGQLGLEITGPGEHKFTDNPAVANLYGVPGKQFRAAVLKIPGSDMGIELVQWGEARTPKGGSIAGAGTVTLTIFQEEAVPDDNGLLHDPDGFPVQVTQRDTPGASLDIDVKDLPATIALYSKLFGFKADGNWLSVPGGSLRIHLTRDKVGAGLNPPFPEPGRGMLRLQVRNIDALTASLKTAGLTVITTGGAPVALPQGPRVIILRDPNNFYFQPMEAR
jgi:catechol 2,3-dioxygenase-like lactoylglutathione lyase family enzyme